MTGSGDYRLCNIAHREDISRSVWKAIDRNRPQPTGSAAIRLPAYPHPRAAAVHLRAFGAGASLDHADAPASVAQFEPLIEMARKRRIN